MAYQNFNQTRSGVKIWKYQNRRSAVDVTHILNSYREKGAGENRELVYAGRICFSVTSDGKYIKAYISKSKAKMLFESIRNGMFGKLFPGGYTDFGGGEKDGKVFSKKLEILVTELNGKKKVAVNIQVMPGKKTNTGAYKPVGPAYEKASSMFDLPDLLEMATEVGDYIKAAEFVALSKGIPFNTLTNLDFERVEQVNQNNQKPNKNPNENTTNSNKQSPVNIVDTQKLREMSNQDYYQMYLLEKERFAHFQNEYDRRMNLKQKNA